MICSYQEITEIFARIFATLTPLLNDVERGYQRIQCKYCMHSRPQTKLASHSTATHLFYSGNQQNRDDHNTKKWREISNLIEYFTFLRAFYQPEPVGNPFTPFVDVKATNSNRILLVFSVLFHVKRR